MARTQQQEDTQPARVMRIYTRALKVPVLIGRVPGGGSIPLGPYTLPQLVGGAVTLVGGALTLDTWGPLGTAGNLALLLLAAIGVTVVLGRIKTGSRNPVIAAIAAAGTITSPTWGRLAGRPVRARRPTRVTHRLLLDLPTAPIPGSTLTTTSTAAPTTAAPTLSQPAPTVFAPPAAAATKPPAAPRRIRDWAPALLSGRAARSPVAPAPRPSGAPLSAVGELLAAAMATEGPTGANTSSTTSPTSRPTAHLQTTRSPR